MEEPDGFHDKAVRLMAEFLTIAGDRLSDDTCTDWNFPEGWTEEEKDYLRHWVQRWNNDPKGNESYERLANWEVANALGYMLLQEYVE